MSEETYKDKKISIKTENNVKKLYIDGTLVNTKFDADSGEYFFEQLPYESYSSLSKLGKDIIDNLS